MEILKVVLDYGLAGLVVYLFYSLFKRELEKMTSAIQDLTRKIDKVLWVIANGKKD